MRRAATPAGVVSELTTPNSLETTQLFSFETVKPRARLSAGIAYLAPKSDRSDSSSCPIGRCVTSPRRPRCYRHMAGQSSWTNARRVKLASAIACSRMTFPKKPARNAPLRLPCLVLSLAVPRPRACRTSPSRRRSSFQPHQLNRSAVGQPVARAQLPTTQCRNPMPQPT